MFPPSTRAIFSGTGQHCWVRNVKEANEGGGSQYLKRNISTSFNQCAFTQIFSQLELDETAPGFNGILTSFYAKLFDMYKVIIPATVKPKINFKSPAIKKICSSINSGAHYLKSHRFFDHPTNTFHESV